MAQPLGSLNVYRYYLFATLFMLCSWGVDCHAQMIKTYENGPVHEAVVTRVSGNTLLEAVPEKPPEPINERIPRQLDFQAEWIGGYWAWDTQEGQFVWVSGAWRRPPPGHQWVTGFWKQAEEGWVWFPGFWSRSGGANLQYINIPPPDPIDENIAPPPSKEYFWSPGFWQFSVDGHEYLWVPGQWEELDSNWVYVPSHYVWRPGGYVFVPGFWDWPLEDRGTAYAAAIIDPEHRDGVVYEPILILKPEIIVRNLYFYYPDYITFFQYHWHFHHDYWVSCACAPPWWQWESWWCFTSNDQWGLWWWYTHPGYPHPSWMTAEINGILPPPNSDLVLLFSKKATPLIVTPNGVVSREGLLKAINKITGEFSPVLTPNRALKARIMTYAKPAASDVHVIYKPQGRKLPLDPQAVRPRVRKPVIDKEALQRVQRFEGADQIRIPVKPRVPSRRNKEVIPSVVKPTEGPIYNPPARQPTWSPRKPYGSQERGPQNRFEPRQPVYPEVPVEDGSRPVPRWRTMTPQEESKIHRPPVRSESIKERIRTRVEDRKGDPSSKDDNHKIDFESQSLKERIRTRVD